MAHCTAEAYQHDMLQCLHKLKIEHTQVGWYQVRIMRLTNGQSSAKSLSSFSQTCFLGSYMSDLTIKTQYEHQAEIPESVALVMGECAAIHEQHIHAHMRMCMQ